MEILLMFPDYSILFIVLTAPVWLLLFELTKQRNDTPRNREIATRLAFKEYELVESINAMRDQMGQKPVDHRPVIMDFRSRGWEIAKAKCRQMALGAVRKLHWATREKS